MSNIIEAVCEGGKYNFNKDEILNENLLNGGYGDVSDVANVLVANLESYNPTDLRLNDDGTIAIVRGNFNDCFEDMMDALRGEDGGDGEDDES